MVLKLFTNLIGSLAAKLPSERRILWSGFTGLEGFGRERAFLGPHGLEATRGG